MDEAASGENLEHDVANRSFREKLAKLLHAPMGQELVDAVDIAFRLLHLNDSCNIGVRVLHEKLDLGVHLGCLHLRDLVKSVLLNDHDLARDLAGNVAAKVYTSEACLVEKLTDLEFVGELVVLEIVLFRASVLQKLNLAFP